jgi:drug/metabolite transporter (DMT)-like permease
VFASARGFLVQTWAQRRTSATRTALACALEPVFSAGFGFWLAGDRLGAAGWAGAALIMAGIVIAEPAAAETLRRLLPRARPI